MTSLTARHYPTHLIESIGLDRGRRLVIRPVLPQDAVLHADFVERQLSPRSRRQRFHGAVKALSPAQLAALADVDHRSHLALAATVIDGGRETQVGEARYVMRDDGDSAEFALAIADGWQGAGLGRSLLERLIDAAQGIGLRRLVGDVLADNAPMLGLARRCGFQVGRGAGGVVAVERALALPRADEEAAPEGPAGALAPPMVRARESSYFSVAR